jgi:hypothetical protein
VRSLSRQRGSAPADGMLTFEFQSRPAATLLVGLSEVFSPGFAVCGRLGEASLQVRPLRQRSAECRLAGACAERPRPESLRTR